MMADWVPCHHCQRPVDTDSAIRTIGGEYRHLDCQGLV